MMSCSSRAIRARSAAAACSAWRSSAALRAACRPRLLVLDEPVAMLDPVARHDFMATVLAAATDGGVSVLLSSHVLTELERVASYLILLARGQVRLAGEVVDLLAAHGRASLEELALDYLRETTPAVTR